MPRLAWLPRLGLKVSESRSVALLSLQTVILLFVFLWPNGHASAIHRRDGIVPLPSPPAVLVFRGGNVDFDGTDWGGRTGFDSLCEGLIRQGAGLLDKRGKPKPIPAAQQIRSGGKVIGFTSVGARYVAYNIDVTTFAVAWNALSSLTRLTLYTCGHAGRREGEPKGGTIILDSGQRFDGFKVLPQFPEGTNASDSPAYPPLRGQTGALVFLHHCYTDEDPDGPAQTMHAVSATIDGLPGVTVIHGHSGDKAQATNIIFQDVEDGNGPAPGPTDAEIETAMSIVEPFPITDLSFPDQYATVQKAIDDGLQSAHGTLPGTVALHLTYGDFGGRADPPAGQEVRSGCPEIDFFDDSVANLSLMSPFGADKVRLRGATTVEVDLASLGDDDGNGREHVMTEIVQLELTGTSQLFGPLTIRVRSLYKHPFRASTGEIEETANNTPGVLDIPPFTPTGRADSFFDVFFEIEAPAAPPGFRLLHNGIPKHMQATITHKPPAGGETYENPDTIPLLDELNRPTGVSIGPASHTPNRY